MTSPFRIIIRSVTLILLLTGCSLDIPYDNQFSDPDAISTPAAARELLADAYNNIPNIEFDLALLSDDFEPTYWAARNPSLNNQYTWQPQAFIDLSTSVWSQYYSVITTINAVNERLPLIKATSDADRRELADLVAEAATLKAYCYFQLLRLYSSDPTDPQGRDTEGIILKNTVAMQNLPRSTVGECIDEIRRLLDDATRSGHQGTDPSWLTADATRLLSAELELYAGNYAEAAETAEALLKEKGFGCFAPETYRYLWDGSQCDERIFMFSSPDVAQSFYQSIVYDTNSGDYYAVASALAADFTENDCRTQWSIYPVTTQALGYQPYIGKYNRLRKEKIEVKLINKMRLSAALFVAAQARCLSGDNEQAAIENVNRYLSMRGAQPLPDNLTGEKLLTAILHQKQMEFVGEGERYFDLKHYRRSVLASRNGRIPDADDYRWLWPLPKDEYLYNENMTQNPGWPKDSFND